MRIDATDEAPSAGLFSLVDRPRVLDGSLVGGGTFGIIAKTWRRAGRAEGAAAYPIDPARHVPAGPNTI